MRNVCLKCKHKVVMHGFSRGKCTVCGGYYNCPHTPADKVCYGCRKKEENKDLCVMCGGDLHFKCDHNKVKIVPTYETAWSIEDRYHIKCTKCGESIKRFQSSEDIDDILSENNYIVVSDKR